MPEQVIATRDMHYNIREACAKCCKSTKEGVILFLEEPGKSLWMKGRRPFQTVDSTCKGWFAWIWIGFLRNGKSFPKTRAKSGLGVRLGSATETGCEVCRSLISRGATESNVIIRSQTDTTGIETGGRALVRRLLREVIQARDEKPLNQHGRQEGSIHPDSQSSPWSMYVTTLSPAPTLEWLWPFRDSVFPYPSASGKHWKPYSLHSCVHGRALW